MKPKKLLRSFNHKYFVDILDEVIAMEQNGGKQAKIIIEGYKEGKSEKEVRELTGLTPEGFRKLEKRFMDRYWQAQSHQTTNSFNASQAERMKIIDKYLNNEYALKYPGPNWTNSIIEEIKRHSVFTTPEDTLFWLLDINSINRYRTGTDLKKLHQEQVKIVKDYASRQQQFGDYWYQMTQYCASRSKEDLEKVLLSKTLLLSQKRSRNYYVLLLNELVKISWAVMVQKKIDNNTDRLLSRLHKRLRKLENNPQTTHYKKLLAFLQFERRYINQNKRAIDEKTIRVFDWTAFGTVLKLHGGPISYAILSRIGTTKSQGDRLLILSLIVKYSLLEKRPPKDEPESIIPYLTFLSLLFFYLEKHQEAIQYLEELDDAVNLTNFRHAEIETRLFQIVLTLADSRPVQAKGLFDKFRRKMKRESWDHDYRQVDHFCAFLKCIFLSGKNNNIKKAGLQLKEFYRVNRKCEAYQLLPWLNIEKHMLKDLLNKAISK